ncbi:MerR family transcriptional regulator [Paenibacillus antri]|uniref:MerR family transcriptional regulator n=1 Tax=Paenibacillus antri TaxID=2582848 RepID=UPI0013050AF9|nr:MerR family transcriptional regulator [Paenibacillus antri]
MKYRPIDIARRLGISTSALRHYEDWGLVPPVARGANGYRIYTEEHLAYFECVRAMSAGFGMALTSDALKRVRSGDFDAALWIVNDALSELQQEKRMAEQTIRALETIEPAELESKGKRKWMTIGEVSKLTAQPASAIRHWEKMGLIDPPRNEENGYRLYGPAEVRHIRIIAPLRTSVWSLETIQRVVRELDRNDLEQARRVARDALRYLHDSLRRRIRGIRHLDLLVELAEGGPAAPRRPTC